MRSMNGSNHFGVTCEGHPATLYTLKSPVVEVDITDYGATIVAIRCSDKHGQMDDVIAGFPDITGYERKGQIFSGTRDEPAVHSSSPDKKMWRSEAKGNRSIKFRYNCHRRDEKGSSESLDICVKYKLCGSELQIQQIASSGVPLVAYPVNRAYFNLSGHNSWRDMGDHLVTLYSGSYLGDDGRLTFAENTPFDLRKPTFFKPDRLELMGEPGGYPHCFCLSETTKRKLAARVKHARNGRTLTIETTSSFVAIDTANRIESLSGKNRVAYGRNSCLSVSPLPWNALNKINRCPTVSKTSSDSVGQSVWLNFSHEL